jgi:hypothetical protein
LRSGLSLRTVAYVYRVIYLPGVENLVYVGIKPRIYLDSTIGTIIAGRFIVSFDQTRKPVIPRIALWTRFTLRPSLTLYTLYPLRSLGPRFSLNTLWTLRSSLSLDTLLSLRTVAYVYRVVYLPWIEHSATISI